MENPNEMTETETADILAFALIQAEWGKTLLGKAVCTTIGYLLVTLFLNWIRATASPWIVWPLILIQLGLYFSIFITGYQCFKLLGINATLALVVFSALAFLGRVIYLFAWEWVAIPLVLAIVYTGAGRLLKVRDLLTTRAAKSRVFGLTESQKHDR